MKKIIFSFIFSIVFISNIFSSEKNKISFPTLNILGMDSITYITNLDLKDSVNTVFINFSPTCDHCERTIKSILQNILKFKQTQFVLTSFEEFGTIRKFYFDNGLNIFSNVFIGQEINFSLTKQIKYSSFPCMVLFDTKQHYIKTIDEESNAKALLKALKIKDK